MNGYNRNGNSRGGSRGNYGNNFNSDDRTIIHGNGRRPQLFELHPTSIKMIQKGHPWVTLDSFSEQFHPNEKFIVGSNRRKPFALLLHDPRHTSVRARLWSKEGNFQKQIKNFKNDFIVRVKEAFKQRKDQKLIEKRDNFYLVFGEADRVPGLFIQLLKDQILVQSYSFFWDKYQDIIVQTVTSQLKHQFGIEILRENIWLQNRAQDGEYKLPAKCLAPHLNYKKMIIEEFGCKYNVSVGEFYDVGIYSDMSSVRERLSSTFANAKSVLNLFSYTGAFSIFAFKQGAQKVTSIDMSEKYMATLEENLKLNGFESHQSLTMPVNDGVKKLIADKESFDLIVCDPPSSSNDGDKRSNAIKDYETLLPQLSRLLSEQGKIVVFLNTHKVNKRRFQEKLQMTIEKKKLPLSLGKFLSLAADCPSMPRFAEGSYLKGFVLNRVKPDQGTQENK